MRPQGTAGTVKRARLVWTPQLHKRFEEAVEKLGYDKAVPKTIMQASPFNVIVAMSCTFRSCVFCVDLKMLLTS